MHDPLDNSLDDALRDVPVPDGLVARVQASLFPASLLPASLFPDDELDATLRSVAVPTGLLGRLRSVPDDEALDEELRHVVVPWGLAVRLRAIARPRWSTPYLARAAVAATLAFVLTGAYWSLLASLLRPIYPAPVPVVEVLLPVDGSVGVVARSEEPVAIETSWLAEARAEDDPLLPTVPVVLESPAAPLVRPSGPLSEMFALRDVPTGRDLFSLLWGEWFGAPHPVDDRLPELEALPALRASGVEPPLVRGFDRAFLFSRGVHPPVFPARHAELQTTSPPLSTRTDSYDFLRRLLSEQRLPAPTDVRVEDFLAALDYAFPRPEPGRVSVRMAAGPAPFHHPERRANLDPGPSLLQVAVQAGDLPKRPESAVHLTVAWDVSASMRWGGRMDLVREAIGRLMTHLHERDRLSVVAFNERVVPVVEAAGRDDAAQVEAALARVRADGGTNLGAGVRDAVALALRDDLLDTNGTGAGDRVRRVVLVTDGRMALSAAEQESLGELMQWAAERGVSFRVFDLSDGPTRDPVLMRLADVSQGVAAKTPNAEALRWSFVEALVGVPTIVAEQARLTVRFDPRTVAAYRLVGHELGGVAPATAAVVQTDLRIGEAATVLFEVWLHPSRLGPEPRSVGSTESRGEDLAEASVEWYDATSRRAERTSQRIGRQQIAWTVSESALSLQAAALAAEVAEVGRQSFNFDLSPNGDTFTTRPKPRDWQHVLEAAQHATSRLADRPDFRRFLSVVRRAQRLRTGASSTREQ